MTTIPPDQFGVSFSLKQCRSFDLDAPAVLNWLLTEAGFRRFRLMSYWNEHEQQPGQYDFSQLDWQIDQVSRAGGEITLCLGARQPRWPENHWPDWAWQADKAVRDHALLQYLEQVITRYADNEHITSYQLENEALLVNFGERSEVDRQRLRAEYDLVTRLNPLPIKVMTTSTSWGIPIRQPIPDMVGFSFYHTLYRDGKYHQSLLYPWVHRVRKILIRVLHNKPVFIHELQLEPWGPQNIWDMPNEEQAKSMNPAQIAKNIALAKAIKASPIDLWGAEWWYWRLQQGDASIWQAVRKALTN
ncbi:MAG: beta-galactosidase [Patescibacteria group bacterium]|nr:beta-galactosidase [Patescibacteria group bacterium]